MIIYVPQGHSANLTEYSSLLNIDGLYTDDFSTCNIIFCIGKNKIVLMHIDYHVPTGQLKGEINLIEGLTDIIIMYKTAGKHLSQQLMHELKNSISNKKIQTQELHDSCYGILVSLPNQMKFDLREKPANLLHHPQEQKLVTVRKVEQIIGARAFAQTKKIRGKKICIFDGSNWEPLEKWHFSVDTSHTSTKEEMEMFTANHTFMRIAGTLDFIIELIQQNPIPILGDFQKTCSYNISYFEDYLNNYDNNLIFRQDLLEILNQKEFFDYDPVSEEDRELKSSLLKLFEKEDEKVAFQNVSELVTKYKENAPKTEFKENFLNLFFFFNSYYHRRKYYQDLYDSYTKQKLQALKSVEEATKQYNDKKYQNAKNLFLEIAQKFAHCCDKSEANLASSYHNLGRSYFRCNELGLAQYFLDKSLNYKQNFVDPEPTLAELKKTQNALNDCKQLKISNKTVKGVTENLNEKFSTP